MALKKYYLGDLGPYYVETGTNIHDPDGDFPGQTQQGLVTNANIVGVSFVGFLTSTIEVTNINDPSTELNAENADSIGALVFCYEVGSSIDEFTMYLWDTAYGSENVPYVVDGSSGGGWVAVAGKHVAGQVKINDDLTLNGLTASTLMLLDSNKKVISHTKDSHISDASTSHAVSSWATTNTALDDLAAKLNSILTAIENAKLTETS